MSEQFYRFAPVARVLAFVALGWRDLGPAPGAHGAWSHVLLWAGVGEPIEPADV